MIQHITEPTRVRNTLDLIATNMPEQVNNPRVIPGISDHAIAYLELSVKPIKKTQPTRKVYLYNKADWKGMRKSLVPCWSGWRRLTSHLQMICGPTHQDEKPDRKTPAPGLTRSYMAS